MPAVRLQIDNRSEPSLIVTFPNIATSEYVPCLYTQNPDNVKPVYLPQSSVSSAVKLRKFLKTLSLPVPPGRPRLLTEEDEKKIVSTALDADAKNFALFIKDIGDLVFLFSFVTFTIFFYLGYSIGYHFGQEDW